MRGFPIVPHSNFSRVKIDIMVIYNARSWKKTKQKIKKMPIIKPKCFEIVIIKRGANH